MQFYFDFYGVRKMLFAKRSQNYKIASALFFFSNFFLIVMKHSDI